MIVSSYTIDRGRSYELDKNSPGTASITLIDTTGELDPTNPAYPFNPMTPATIALRNPVTATTHQIFTGYVSRFDYDLYQTEKYAVATLELVDGMDLLSAVEMTGATFGDLAPLPGYPSTFIHPEPYFDRDDQVADRINQVLNQAGYSVGLREIFSGNVKVRETAYAPRASALSAIEDAADAEFPGVANFYFQKDGRATFHGRLARFFPDVAQYHISKWRAGDHAAVTADSTRSLIFELSFDKDKDKVINWAISTPQGIADSAHNGQVVKDASSIATYGTRSISFENLLTYGGYLGGTTALVETKKFATYYVNNYKTPRARINRITFKRLPPSHANAGKVWAILCGVDISDIIRLKTTHQGGGFDEDFYVEGLHYSCQPLSNTYDDVTLTLDVSPASYYSSNPF